MAVMEALGKTLLKVFKSSSERYVKKRQEFVNQVLALEDGFSQMTDSQLLTQSEELRNKILEMEDKIIGAPLREKLREFPSMPEAARTPAKKRMVEQLQQCCDGVLAEAFAAVREASDRHLGVRNVFDKEFEFDETCLSSEMQALYKDVSVRINEGEDVQQIELPPDFYAQVREKHPWRERPPFRFRHFDVQMIGGGVLYEGQIAEMATGEGKTLVATLAAYIVALSGRKVHVITVNDYLAQRDCDWMGPVYRALGLTVGAIQSDMDTAGDVRRQQYSCDITYGTNNEFGFDYLRDNMKVTWDDQVQGPLDFSIIDEVDSILIDEARTPLIISGPAQDDTTRYQKADNIARELLRMQKPHTDIEKQINQAKLKVANARGELSESKKDKDQTRIEIAETEIDKLEVNIIELEEKLQSKVQYYEVEYDRHSVHLTHEGIGAAQEIAGIGSFYVGSNMEWPHLMEQSLRAHVVFEKEKDYVVQNNEVIIVDEFTGRLMQGRQWSDGLHQAVEAKEKVKIKQESQTLATITLQNFFKMYQQLSGMTGTAMTEDEEFMKIYQLGVVAIPTNKPIVRDDREDLVYKTVPEKFNAIVDEIFESSKAGHPMLIGTISIEKNEALSAALTKRYSLDHELLNAKQHAREASIVAKAGQRHEMRNGEEWGNVTVATNMAGRGTDIKLANKVRDAGGLYVMGTERHEARRIDNQLRGRCGRQGDPGISQFFLSFEDDLMRIFAPDWIIKAFERIGWQEGEPIEHKRITKYVEKAQKKVEQRNFEARKSLLEYDEVMDYQRQVFYTRRQAVLEGRRIEAEIWEMIDGVISDNCGSMLDKNYPYECVGEWARTIMGVDVEQERIRNNDVEEIENTLKDHAKNNADQDITITLGEYMSDDVEPRDWDLRGLSKWAMSKFGVSVSQNKLRELAFDDVQRQLSQAAAERVDKYDCSLIGSFLEEDYPQKCLAEWVNQKFTLEVKTEELVGMDRSKAEDFLGRRARQKYHCREIEYPVDFILSVSMRNQQAGASFAAQEIVDWAKHKFNLELEYDEIQQLSYDKLRKRLTEINQSYWDGQLDNEICGRLNDCNWQDESVEQLAQWSNDWFESKLRPDQLDVQTAAETIQKVGRQFLRKELTELERYVLLQILDSTWKDHLYAMDHLKSSIGLRGFAEKDPKMEYKREGFRMFEEMLSNVRDKVTDIIFKAQLGGEDERRSVWNISNAAHDDFSQFSAQQQAAQAPQGDIKIKTIKHEVPKVGRNDPCPCGSGKKYKKCCGRET